MPKNIRLLSDKKASTRLKKLLFVDVFLGLTLFVYLAKLSPVVSVFFAKSLSRPYRTAAGFLTSLVPFSVTEFLIIVAVLFALVFVASLISLLFRKKWRKILDKLISLVLVVSAVAAVYSLTAQFDYERPTPDKPWIAVDMSLEEYRTAIVSIAKDAGQIAASFPKDKNGYSIAPSFAETAKKMQAEVQKYAGGDYGYYVPLPKKVWNSWEMDLTNILGITFAPTNEVNMNANISNYDLPYYMAHELAHSLGIMSEREANIFAAFVTLNSDDAYIRYSGYRALIDDLIQPIRDLDRDKNYHMEQRMREESIRLGLPEFLPDADVSLEVWEWYFQQFKELGGEDCLNYIYGRGETEIAFRKSLGADFFKDAEIPYYTKNLPKWMSEISAFFGKVGEWFNDIYLKSSGSSSGTGSYDTGDSILIPDGGNPDGGEEDKVIVYSETVKIFLWVFQTSGSAL